MPPRKRKTIAEIRSEIEADRQKERDRNAWLDANPHLRRLDQADGLGDPIEVLLRQVTVSADHAVARAIRNQLEGRGKTLRELGWVEVADVLEAMGVTNADQTDAPEET